MVKTVDLGDYRTYPGAKVFSGRPRGEEVRRIVGLDRLDRAQDCVEIRIPEDTYTFNMSFFLGLCSESVKAYGPENFERHYRFTGPSVILTDLPEYVDQAVKESLVLKAAAEG